MSEPSPLRNRILNSALSLTTDALKTSYGLFKITIPISILTKVLTFFGATDYLAALLGPVMELVGLPGSMGLVWATAIVTHLYGGMVVFASLAPEASLTVAQVTVLTTMMLVAHALPVELRIAQKAGARICAMGTLRILSAFVLGWLLHQIYAGSDLLKSPNSAIWQPEPLDPSWSAWARGETENLLTIFIIIFLLLFLLKLFNRLGITGFLIKQFGPLLSIFGMSRNAAPITLIGMTLGISYGGALIIQEAQSGRITKHDVFSSLSLMGLSHGMIEDTLLMMIIGGHLTGILAGRVVFSLLVIALLGQLLPRMPEDTFHRFFYRDLRQDDDGTLPGAH